MQRCTLDAFIPVAREFRTSKIQVFIMIIDKIKYFELLLDILLPL